MQSRKSKSAYFRKEMPLVTVICLCYNHRDYLQESVASVLNQTYQNLQIIIVDDASTDGSQEVIESYRHDSRIEVICLPENLGNCKAFNRGLSKSKGKYIVDLATDDALYPNRIEQQVDFFETLDEKTGVVFSNSEYIDHWGHHLKYHYPVSSENLAIKKVPDGDIFSNLLSKYFISPPSMMIKKTVFDKLRGYNEQLAYEDFDFWIRSSRHFHYAYQDLVLTKVRKLKSSLSSGLYIPGDKQLFSTYLVCEEAVKLIQSQNEKSALIKRVKFEIRQAVFSENFKEACLFLDFLQEIDRLPTMYNVLKFINNNKLKLSLLRKIYHFLKY